MAGEVLPVFALKSRAPAKILLKYMITEQKNRLLELVKQLRAIAQPIGPLHSFWDVIFDIESFIEGKETLIQKTAEEWIVYAENILRKF